MSRRIGRPHPWTDVDGCPALGVELWSLATDAAESWRGPRDVLDFLRSPERAAAAPPARAIAEWDRLCMTRRVPAVGGLDAHQTGVRIASRVFSPMPHERYFRLLQTHALCHLPEGAPVDDGAVLDALSAGRAFLARPWVGDARGFRFWAERGESALEMGAEAPASDGWTIRVSAPAGALLRIVRGGVPITQTRGRELEYRATEPGAYRVEARRNALAAERLWILSNPLYLR